MKWWVVVLLGMLCLLVAAAWSWPSAKPRLIVCAVGQGDALLLTQNFTQILIDGGPDDKVLECLQKQLPWWDKKLELVVSTHPDADHIGGLPSVIDRYAVNELWISPATTETALYARLVAAAEKEVEQGMKILQPTLGHQKVVSNELILKVLAPLPETQLWDAKATFGEEMMTTNNRSIVMEATLNGYTIGLTGDMEAVVEQALLERGVIKDWDVLKVAHHGSKTSTTEKFAHAAKPEVALISVGPGNRFGHPALSTLKTLHFLESCVLRTDQDGTITAELDESSHLLKAVGTLSQKHCVTKSKK
jgi:competence protein ComEC